MVELWQLVRVPRVAEDSGSSGGPVRGRRAGPRLCPAPPRTRSPPAATGKVREAGRYDEGSRASPKYVVL